VRTRTATDPFGKTPATRPAGGSSPKSTRPSSGPSPAERPAPRDSPEASTTAFASLRRSREIAVQRSSAHVFSGHCGQACMDHSWTRPLHSGGGRSARHVHTCELRGVATSIPAGSPLNDHRPTTAARYSESGARSANAWHPVPASGDPQRQHLRQTQSQRQPRARRHQRRTGQTPRQRRIRPSRAGRAETALAQLKGPHSDRRDRSATSTVARLSLAPAPEGGEAPRRCPAALPLPPSGLPLPPTPEQPWRPARGRPRLSRTPMLLLRGYCRTRPKRISATDRAGPGCMQTPASGIPAGIVGKAPCGPKFGVQTPGKGHGETQNRCQ
jgi:hypothetical protein